MTYQGFKRASASANLLFRKKLRAVKHSFNAVSKAILGNSSGNLNNDNNNNFFFFFKESKMNIQNQNNKNQMMEPV